MLTHTVGKNTHTLLESIQSGEVIMEINVGFPQKSTS